VRPFIDDYSHGITPNPCLACNRQVRWGFLLDRARALGASKMATGHYARLSRQPGGHVGLLRAVDRDKDQSYVLHVLNQNQLSQALFPLGEFSKQEVRKLASQFGLPVADRKDSQDLCFLAGEDYRAFLARNAPQTLKRGPIYDASGKQIGEHQGLAYYTIGQRKGLGLVSKTPQYVVSKNLHSNSLIVGSVSALGTNCLKAGPVNWIAGSPPKEPFRAQVKIRYKANPEWANVIPSANNLVSVEFDRPIRDITPGQAAVFYTENLCLGGGLILAGDPDCQPKSSSIE
jgi:tRNA-specific 2-thiouridylase